MAIAIEPGSPLKKGQPSILFEGDYVQENAATGAHQYDVSRDGQKFLMISRGNAEEHTSAERQIVVGLNWIEELKRLVPMNGPSPRRRLAGAHPLLLCSRAAFSDEPCHPVPSKRWALAVGASQVHPHEH